MLDTTQILLLILITILGATLVLVGIQFYFILRELKKGLEQVNRILDEFHEAAGNITTGTQHVKESLYEVKELATSVKEGVSTPLVSGIATFGLVRSILKPILGDDNEGSKKSEE